MHLSLGSERDAVYPFLDFTKDYDLAVKYVLGMTFGAQSGTILKSNYGMKLSDTLVIDRTIFNIVLKFYSALFLYSKNWNFGFGKRKMVQFSMKNIVVSQTPNQTQDLSLLQKNLSIPNTNIHLLPYHKVINNLLNWDKFRTQTYTHFRSYVLIIDFHRCLPSKLIK